MNTRRGRGKRPLSQTSESPYIEENGSDSNPEYTGMRLRDSGANPFVKLELENSATKKSKKSDRSSVGGLQIFTKLVCEKLQENLEMSNSSIADVLVREYSTGDEKKNENIRRRVYDALSVIQAVGLAEKNGKTYKWIGKPTLGNMNDSSNSIRDEVNRLKQVVIIKRMGIKKLIKRTIGLEYLAKSKRVSSESDLQQNITKPQSSDHSLTHSSSFPLGDASAHSLPPRDDTPVLKMSDDFTGVRPKQPSSLSSTSSASVSAAAAAALPTEEGRHRIQEAMPQSNRRQERMMDVDQNSIDDINELQFPLLMLVTDSQTQMRMETDHSSNQLYIQIDNDYHLMNGDAILSALQYDSLDKLSGLEIQYLVEMLLKHQVPRDLIEEIMKVKLPSPVDQPKSQSETMSEHDGESTVSEEEFSEE